ncbi:MAG: peptidoglycan bridge formation glycyltransferase FemA/FemB family protein, partial [bacterium]
MKHICQSKEWAQFKESYGNKAVPAGGVTFFKTKIPLIPYFAGYCPKADLTKVDFSKVAATAKSENCVFVKFDPINLIPPYPSLPPYPLKKTQGVFAKETIILDLIPPLEDLKAGLKSKTRYNVGLARRKGVKVREGGEADLEIFLKLQKETAKRQGFFVHPDEYFRKMWAVLYPAGMLKLLVAEVEGQPVAVWIFFVYNKVFYYPYGASSYKYRDYMPSDLLMWEAIKLAQKLECGEFDMWGATSNQTDPWWGFTRFKLGFGGKMVEFAESYDLVVNKPLYYAFQAA